MSNGSNIAAAINAAHASVEQAKQEGVRHAIECGRLLQEAKATVAHGQWDAWVSKQCSFSMRTAQLYMKVGKYVGDDPAKAQRVADLSLREIARLMARPTLDEVMERSGFYKASPGARDWSDTDKDMFIKMMRWWKSAKPEWRTYFKRRLKELAKEQGVVESHVRFPEN